MFTTQAVPALIDGCSNNWIKLAINEVDEINQIYFFKCAQLHNENKVSTKDLIHHEGRRVG